MGWVLKTNGHKQKSTKKTYAIFYEKSKLKDLKTIKAFSVQAKDVNKYDITNILLNFLIYLFWMYALSYFTKAGVASYSLFWLDI